MVLCQHESPHVSCTLGRPTFRCSKMSMPNTQDTEATKRKRNAPSRHLLIGDRGSKTRASPPPPPPHPLSPRCPQRGPSESIHDSGERAIGLGISWPMRGGLEGAAPHDLRSKGAYQEAHQRHMLKACGPKGENAWREETPWDLQWCGSVLGLGGGYDGATEVLLALTPRGGGGGAMMELPRVALEAVAQPRFGPIRALSAGWGHHGCPFEAREAVVVCRTVTV
jgi:hypothetical protein